MVARNDYERVALLQRMVAADRARLQTAISRVRTAAKQKLDIAGKVAEHRWAWLGAGFAIGLLLGARHE
jgi:ElaB/YqjD/DUF883 family membrane-anchored ribosome-binding protein